MTIYSEDVRQTKEYAMFLSLVGWKPISLSKDDFREKQYAYMWKISHTPFCIICIHRARKIDFREIEKIALKYNAISVRIEANIAIDDDYTTSLIFKKHGFAISDWIQTPTKTSVLNLKQSMQSIHNHFAKGVRYSIRKAIKNGVTVQIITGNKILSNPKLFNIFLTFVRNHEKSHKLENYPDVWMKCLIQSFSSRAMIVLAMHKSKYLACGLFLRSSNSIHYCRGTVNELGKQLNAMSLCVWESIRQAKKMDVNNLDFEGIYDPRYAGITESWKGFSTFKQSFGGNDITFIPAYEKIFIQNLPLGYRILKGLYLPKHLPGIYVLRSE